MSDESKQYSGASIHDPGSPNPPGPGEQKSKADSNTASASRHDPKTPKPGGPKEQHAQGGGTTTKRKSSLLDRFIQAVRALINNPKSPDPRGPTEKYARAK